MAEAPHQSGKVRFLSRPMRFLLMVVEQGTASRWCELLGRVGTHWLFLLAFCSLGDTDTRPLSLWAKSRPPASRSWPVDACRAPAGPRPPWGPLCAQLRGGYSPGSKRHLLRVAGLGEEERAGAPAARSWPVDARQAPAGPRPPWGPLCAQLRGGYSPGSKRHLLGVAGLGEEERAGAPAQFVSCHPC